MKLACLLSESQSMMIQINGIRLCQVQKIIAKGGIVFATEIHRLERGTDAVQFEPVDALMGQFNEYVGENGRLTPMVKNVTIRMNRPEL